MNIVLVEPQIPPNTGNIARLCAATGIRLHLVGPLGFELSDRYLKRAGLDYWEYVSVVSHPSVEAFFSELPAQAVPYFFSKRANRLYTDVTYTPDDYLVFGSETEGLPSWLFERYPLQFLKIPMFCHGVRSLNLSSAAAIVAYEALRQLDFISEGRKPL